MPRSVVIRKYIAIFIVIAIFRTYLYIIYTTRFGLRLQAKYMWLDFQPAQLPVFHIYPIRHGNDCMKLIEFQPPPCRTSTLLFLAINSHAKHHSRRNGIRKSWASSIWLNGNNNETWKTVFIVGLTGDPERDVRVNHEASYHGDMIILNSLESHHSLTDKTVTGMHWASKYCQPKFFYKGDDDVWVNKWRIYDYITRLNTSVPEVYDNHWVGFVSYDNRKPIRNIRSKYYVSHEHYRWGLFPPYCSGFANIMSGQALRKMLDATNYIEKLPGIDDVYIGLLAYKSGIQPISNLHFRFDSRPLQRNITKRYVDQTLALHGVTKPDKQLLLNDFARRIYIGNQSIRSLN